MFLRALLTKLETVESALEGAGGSVGSGAIPKRKPHSRRLRQSGHRCEVIFHRSLPEHTAFRSGSLDGGRRREGQEGGDRRRGAWRRPTLQLEEQAEEEEANYSMPASSTLYDDAAGLKLFLDILNGPDGQNKEAEAELRKLIDRRRMRMAEEGEGRRRTVEDEVMESLEGERSRKSKIAARRRRRHHAAAQGDQVAVPEVVLDERRTEEGRKKEEEAGGRRREEGEGGRRREKRSGRRTRPEPLPPQVNLNS